MEAEGVTTIKVADDEEGHKKMEEMLKNGEIDGAVKVAHFPFPIGVSTVGRCVTLQLRKKCLSQTQQEHQIQTVLKV